MLPDDSANSFQFLDKGDVDSNVLRIVDPPIERYILDMPPLSSNERGVIAWAGSINADSDNIESRGGTDDGIEARGNGLVGQAGSEYAEGCMVSIVYRC